MWDEVKCYGKLSKIKTREHLYSPMSCVVFIAQPLTEPCLCCPWRWVLMTDCRPWKEWECCIQWRWRCLHNTLSFTLYGLFCSLSLFTLCLLFFSYPFFGSMPPPLSLSLPLSFQFPVFLSSLLCRSCHLLKSWSLFHLSLFHNSAVICPTTFLPTSTFSSFCQPLPMAPV